MFLPTVGERKQKKFSKFSKIKIKEEKSSSCKKTEAEKKKASLPRVELGIFRCMLLGVTVGRLNHLAIENRKLACLARFLSRLMDLGVPGNDKFSVWEWIGVSIACFSCMKMMVLYWSLCIIASSLFACISNIAAWWAWLWNHHA